MNRKNVRFFILILLMSSLLSAAFARIILVNVYANKQYETLSVLTQQFISEYPEDTQTIIQFIKDSRNPSFVIDEQKKDFLSQYGFQPKDFAAVYWRPSLFTVLLSVCIFFFFLFLIYYIWKRNCRQRIDDLTYYLEKINLDRDITILPCIEDDFSLLQDEIYKTVTKLFQAKEAALKERKNFAENLENISHQIKTPVSSISIMAQLYEKEQNPHYLVQMKKQVVHLQCLVDALLTLSKIDAGVLKLEKQQINVYSMLQVAVEMVDEIIRRKKIEVILPNYSEIQFWGDMEWTVEAFINLIKNCAEHMPESGKIQIHYSQNPLYTEIIIQDNGTGFDEKELPHIFKRFYQGRKAVKTGLGIGLSLSKSIIEMQNGFITAKNVPEGGACYIVRFYSH